MELTTVKLTVTREELKNGQPAAAIQNCGDTISLPVDELILGMLHRMIEEDKRKESDSGQSSSVRQVLEQ